MTLQQEQLDEMLEMMQGWKDHLEDMKPLLNLLHNNGCSPGEALVILELNRLGNYMEKIMDGPGEDWRDA